MTRSVDVLQTLYVRVCSTIDYTSVVQNLANYGVLWARCESRMGRNALHCMRRYNAGLSDCLYLEICYEGYI